MSDRNTNKNAPHPAESDAFDAPRHHDDDCGPIAPYVPNRPAAAETAAVDVAPAAADDDRSDAESMESDYYYDDDGKMRTYYRPKKRLSNVSKRSRKSNHRSVDPTPRNGSHHQQHVTATIALQDASYEMPEKDTNNNTNAPDNIDDDGDKSSVASHGTTATVSTTHNGTGGTGSISSSMRNGSFGQLPANLRGIGKKIHKLSTEELLYISAIVGRKAHREAYSVLQYSGAAWYLPNIRKCHEGEPHWGIDYEWGAGLILSIAGKRMEVPILSWITRAALLVLLWFAIWNAIPKKLSERAGYIFDPVVTLLVCAVVGGFLCRIFQIPPLVGCLWIGILWNNIGPEVGYLTHGIYKDVRTISSRMGITVVLLRAGFSLSWKTVRPILPNVVALIFGAYGVESIVGGFFGMFEYNDYSWAFLQSCLCAAPSAAVVVPGSLMLQSEGYSKTKGPLPVMLAAVGIETVLAVWVVSFLIDFKFGTMSVGLSSALGPIQIIAGSAIGVALGFIFHLFVRLFLLEANRLPTGKYAETHLQNVRRNALITMLLIAHATIFFAYFENLAGGGAVAVMMFACTISNFWTYDNHPEWVEHKKELGSGLCDVWDLFVMPFLFSMTGSKIYASKIFNKTFFPKALAVWVVSNASRMFAISFTSIGLGFTWKERLFQMGGYCAKATVQSALASAALDKVTKKLAAADKSDTVLVAHLNEEMQKAMDVQNMAIFYVMWSAPLAAVLVTKLGPRVLFKEA